MEMGNTKSFTTQRRSTSCHESPKIFRFSFQPGNTATDLHSVTLPAEVIVEVTSRMLAPIPQNRNVHVLCAMTSIDKFSHTTAQALDVVAAATGDNSLCGNH